MARVTVAPTAPPTYVAAVSGLTVAPVAADTSNLNQYKITGNEVLIAMNVDASIHNVTVTSAPDVHGRVQHITTDPVAAAVASVPGIKVYPKFPQQAWMQTDGFLYFQADSAFIKFIVLQTQ